MNPNAEPMLLISKRNAQEVVDYLKQRPFHEVFQLINGLLRLAPAEVPPAPAPAPAQQTGDPK